MGNGDAETLGMRGRAGRASVNPVLFHPDYTVGSGVTPDLLTLGIAPEALAGFGLSTHLPPVGNCTPP